MKYISPKELAFELEVSKATIIRWINEGRIPAQRLGPRTIRIFRSDVEHMFMRNQTTAVTTAAGN